MPQMTIAGLARAAGVGVETVRYYQRRGLLYTPDRPGSAGHGSGFRRYDDEDLRRLRFIRSAQAAGFTLEQIAELIALDSTDDRARARELAIERIAALDTKIAEMQAARDALAHLARECGAGSSGPCPIITAFDNRASSEHLRTRSLRSAAARRSSPPGTTRM
jgi:MerR family transcriptional regulator, mercuric resistance operon regulatory protein